jgi:hypothetical protein
MSIPIGDAFSRGAWKLQKDSKMGLFDPRFHAGFREGMAYIRKEMKAAFKTPRRGGAKAKAVENTQLIGSYSNISPSIEKSAFRRYVPNRKSADIYFRDVGISGVITNSSGNTWCCIYIDNIGDVLSGLDPDTGQRTIIDSGNWYMQVKKDDDTPLILIPFIMEAEYNENLSAAQGVGSGLIAALDGLRTGGKEYRYKFLPEVVVYPNWENDGNERVRWRGEFDLTKVCNKYIGQVEKIRNQSTLNKPELDLGLFVWGPDDGISIGTSSRFIYACHDVTSKGSSLG